MFGRLGEDLENKEVLHAWSAHVVQIRIMQFFVSAMALKRHTPGALLPSRSDLWPPHH